MAADTDRLAAVSLKIASRKAREFESLSLRYRNKADRGNRPESHLSAVWAASLLPIPLPARTIALHVSYLLSEVRLKTIIRAEVLPAFLGRESRYHQTVLD
jgi:hypothetical protein